jgi:hypothetical protein
MKALGFFKRKLKDAMMERLRKESLNKVINFCYTVLILRFLQEN